MGEKLQAPKSPALRAMFWRSEILQVLYWLRGEGLGDEVAPALLERFLGVQADIAVTYLDRLVEDGYLVEPTPGLFALSATGMVEGGEEFEAAFSGMTKPAHGECSADCWCHVSIEEAEACFTERTGHGPGDAHDEQGHDH